MGGARKNSRNVPAPEPRGLARAEPGNVERTWRPRLQHRIALRFVLEELPRRPSKAEIAAKVEVDVSRVRSWFRQPEFASWWNAELLRWCAGQRHAVVAELLGLVEDASVPPRDRILAAKAYLENTAAPAQTGNTAIREIFRAMEAGKLSPAAEVRAAWRDGVGGEGIVEVLRRQEATDELAERGRRLGVIEAPTGKSQDQAALHAIAVLAQRQATEQQALAEFSRWIRSGDAAKDLGGAAVVEECAQRWLESRCRKLTEALVADAHDRG